EEVIVKTLPNEKRKLKAKKCLAQS
nr:hypothetical protein [Tanacetum cinerariifolium]